MALFTPVFFKRTASAVFFVAIMLYGLLHNTWTALALVSVIQFLCYREYFALMRKMDPETVWPSWLPWLVQGASLLLLWASAVMVGYQFLWPAFLCVPAVLLLGTFLSPQNATQAGMQALGGMLYIGLPMVLLLQIRFRSELIPVAIIFMIWTSDTMAYISGSLIGRTPLSKLSPKKTWEGTLGGVALTILAGALWGYFSKSSGLIPYYNMADWMILALIVSATGPLGDLLESKLKRMADVKDSGFMMPGHGGALDRFDSLLIAVPFTFCYVWFFMPSVHIP
jgi:phosphatidate cytidylyltransferase